ncbi:fimbrial protein [Aeromonas hydrophila]|uniref:fimbrial protein n=1 Tax=Aeromonas hydrophila TaxID=644 RepID=UPI0039886345
MKLATTNLTGWAGIGLLLSMLGNLTPAYAIDVFFTGKLVASPPCIINGNNAISVDFGENILIGRIDGVNYEQPINYTMDCSAAVSTAQKLLIAGEPFSSNPVFLATSKPGLGIKIKVDNQPLWPLNTLFSFTDPARPTLKAVLVRDSNVTLTGGAFTATATLVVNYQ